MAQFPALPLFTDAYLADTTHLTTIEHGAYLLLLIVAWRSPDCGLPINSRELMKYTKLSSGQFKRIWPILEPFFYEENGRLFQGRLLDELETVRRLTQQRSDAGKASALKRNKRDQRALVRNGNEKQAPTPTPTPTKKTKEKKGVQIPQDWSLEDKNIEYALEKGFLNGQILELGESFKDYWLADATPKGKKKDWDAAWRTWVRNAIKFGGGNNNEIGERFR